MEGIEELLRALSDDDGDEEKSDSNAGSGQSEGIFSGLDPEMLLKLMTILPLLKEAGLFDKLL